MAAELLVEASIAASAATENQETEYSSLDSGCFETHVI